MKHVSLIHETNPPTPYRLFKLRTHKHVLYFTSKMAAKVLRDSDEYVGDRRVYRGPDHRLGETF